MGATLWGGLGRHLGVVSWAAFERYRRERRPLI